MSYEEQIADILRPVNFDPARLTDTARAELYRLARIARVELPRPGSQWGSNPSAESFGFQPTPAPGFPLRPR